MSAPGPDAAAVTPAIIIGVRRYHAATGEITIVRAPVRMVGVKALISTGGFPLCECPQAPACRDRRPGR